MANGIYVLVLMIITLSISCESKVVCERGSNCVLSKVNSRLVGDGSLCSFVKTIGKYQQGGSKGFYISIPLSKQNSLLKDKPQACCCNDYAECYCNMDDVNGDSGKWAVIEFDNWWEMIITASEIKEDLKGDLFKLYNEYLDMENGESKMNLQAKLKQGAKDLVRKLSTDYKKKFNEEVTKFNQNSNKKKGNQVTLNFKSKTFDEIESAVDIEPFRFMMVDRMDKLIMSKLPKTLPFGILLIGIPSNKGFRILKIGTIEKIKNITDMVRSLGLVSMDGFLSSGENPQCVYISAGPEMEDIEAYLAENIFNFNDISDRVKMHEKWVKNSIGVKNKLSMSHDALSLYN